MAVVWPHLQYFERPVWRSSPTFYVFFILFVCNSIALWKVIRLLFSFRRYSTCGNGAHILSWIPLVLSKARFTRSMNEL